MTDVSDTTQVALTLLHVDDDGAIAQAIRKTGCRLEICPSVEELAQRAQGGDLHGVILATGRPEELSKPAVRALLSAQADISVMFLVPDRANYWKYPALRGATMTQVQNLSVTPERLGDLLRAEVQSIAAARPEYGVVCVDDDLDFLRSLEGLLPSRLAQACGRFRLRFEFCASAGEAIALARSGVGGKLALIISDQMMPEMNGVDLLRRVKAICPETQRVLLTGYAGMESAIVAINEQVLHKYLTKPIEQPAEFVDAITHLLMEYHLNRTRNIDRGRLITQFGLIQALARAHDLPTTIEVVGQCLGESLGSTGSGHELAVERRWAILLAQAPPYGSPSKGSTALAMNGRLSVYGTGLLPRELTPGAHMPASGSATPQDECSGPGTLFDWVMRNNRPVFALGPEDLPAGVRSLVPPPLMAVPLPGQDSAIGLVLVNCLPGATPFTRMERVMLTFVADAVAVMLTGLADRKALQDHYVSTMACLMEAVEAKDIYTRGHTDRVCELAMELGRSCGLSGSNLRDLEHASLLHDIGKIAVPDSIINKPQPLTEQECAVMKQHPARGEKILQPLRFLDRARLILRSHHERYDGCGYPDGLTGEEIPFGARILSIADSYDAMTSVRPYRQAMSHQRAMDELRKNAGIQFDPMLVARFVELMSQKSDLTAGASNNRSAVAIGEGESPNRRDRKEEISK